MSQRISRRHFLRTASAAAATGVIPTATGALRGRALEGPDSPALYAGEVIDTHQHLWNLKELRLPWVSDLKGKPKEVLGHDYLLSDYAEATRGLNVTRAVYMEVDVAEEDQVKEAEFVTRVCAEGKSPMAAAVIAGRPASDGFKDHLDRFKGNKFIKGLRQVLHTPATPPGFCLEEKFVQGVRLLGERGLRFDLCLRNDQLDHGAELVDRCPDTRFVLDHCGNPHNGKLDLAGWRKALAKVANARNRHVLCKVSGLYANVSAAEWPAEKLAPIVREVIDRFGWDRVLFAGDWPVVNLGASFKPWLEAVKQIVRSDRPEDQKKLFLDNAMKFYQLT
jgi:predicted TIM-barrel fold metal-dependent hydrolase